MYNDSQSIYAAPALESTLLLEAGGLDDKFQIGELPSTNLSAAVSAGTRTFQYNRYFWNKELFTFNYTNNAVGVAIAYYSASKGTYYFAILPIFLPRVAMTLAQSITSSVTDEPDNRTALMREMVYYLNMGFTSLGVGNNYGVQQLGPSNFRIAPWVTAQDAKGSPYSPHTGDMIVNNPYFPIFQDGATAPPLVWDYLPNSYQLMLRVNPDFFTEDYANDKIGFQIISLESYMADSPLVSDPSFAGGFQSPLTYYAGLNNAPESSYGAPRGWCSQGAFATGFGQTQYYETGPGNQTEDPGFTYSDVYTSAERRALWAATLFPRLDTNSRTYLQFSNLCQQFKLVSNAGNGTGYLISNFITSLLPARFFTIESDALTRNQKRPVVSNNPNVPPGCMAIQLLTLDTLRTWEDNTVAGLTSSAGSILFGSRKSGVDDCSIVALDPMQSLQTLDLILRDEWGNILKNYMELNDMTTAEEAAIMGYDELFFISPGLWIPAAWVLALQPPPGYSNREGILINESWWSSVYQFYSFNPVSTTRTTTPSNFIPSAPRSITLSHFGRVLGY